MQENICKRYPLLNVIEMNHDKDHVHLFLSIPPSQSEGIVVRLIKSNTGKIMKQKFAFLKEVYRGSDGIWSDGYFVSTAGIDEDIIRNILSIRGKKILDEQSSK